MSSPRDTLPSPPRLSVVVCTIDREQALIRCLESIYRQDYRNIEVVVLDDGSRRLDVAATVRARFPQETPLLLRNPAPTGVACGRNKAMAATSGDLVVVVDDDAYFERTDAVSSVVARFAAEPALGILAGKIVDVRNGAERLLIPFPRAALRRDPDAANRPGAVSYFLGGCHAIRREVLTATGGYGNELIFGEEELDLSYKAVEAGFGLGYEPAFLVRHEPWPSAFGSATKTRDELYYHVANRVVLAYKHLPWRYGIPFVVTWMARYALRALRERRCGDFLAGVSRGVSLLGSLKRAPIGAKAVDYLRCNHGRLWY